jgi:ribosomal protein S18 acetylase RimI-like enzyme
MAELIKQRALIAEDAPRVATLVRAAFAAQAVATDPPASAMRVTANDLTTHLRSNGGGAVAEAAAQIVGSILWSEQDCGLYISRLAVDPKWRRRGIALALLAAAEAAARAMGLPRLHLGTRLALTDNRALFAGAGFVEVSRHAHPGYAQPTWVAMEKRLSAGKGGAVRACNVPPSPNRS